MLTENRESTFYEAGMDNAMGCLSAGRLQREDMEALNDSFFEEWGDSLWFAAIGDVTHIHRTEPWTDASLAWVVGWLDAKGGA